MISALILAVLLAQAVPSASPEPAPSAERPECLAARATAERMQLITYPDHLTLTDTMVRTFRATHPKAGKGAFWIVTYLDGHVQARYADDPAYNGEFEKAILDFGSHLKVTPTMSGCDNTIGGVFVMVFTIPDGRVRLVPVKPPQPAPSPTVYS